MNQKEAQIIFLQPVFKQTIWGGTRLKEQFSYQTASECIGECWGISAHPNGESIVGNGMYRGMTLSMLWKNHPELFGYDEAKEFPLLVKIIDARSDLSIQVHPNDTYAMKYEHGAYGKTECWYILDCPENATLVIGHHAKNKEELEKMIREERWEELICEVPVKKGDFIQIDPGTIHAIKGGLLLLETQQNSDITYRLYDYGRLENGKLRELHIEKSIDVITYPEETKKDHEILHTADWELNGLHLLYRCDYYVIYKMHVSGETRLEQKYPFLLGTVTYGEGRINEERVKKGDHFILPYGIGNVEVYGEMEVIFSTVP